MYSSLLNSVQTLSIRSWEILSSLMACSLTARQSASHFSSAIFLTCSACFQTSFSASMIAWDFSWCEMFSHLEWIPCPMSAGVGRNVALKKTLKIEKLSNRLQKINNTRHNQLFNLCVIRAAINYYQMSLTQMIWILYSPRIFWCAWIWTWTGFVSS